MVARSLFPFDRTLAQTITIVTEGSLCCCREFMEGCRASRAVSGYHGSPVSGYFGDTCVRAATIQYSAFA